MFEWKRWLGVGCAAVVVVLLSGCPPQTKSTTSTAQADGEKEPPHKGDLFAVPDHKIHAELVRTPKDTKAEIYLLDSKVDKPVLTTATELTLTIKGTPPKTVKLKAEKQAGEPEGKTSHFVATDQLLNADLKPDDVELSVMIDGKPYTFTPDKD